MTFVHWRTVVAQALLGMTAMSGNSLVHAADVHALEPGRAAILSLQARPEVRPLLRYLRCEEDRLNSLGEIEQPMEALSYVAHQMKQSRNHDRFPLQVWPGLTAQVEVAAGYGFFSMWQSYPRASKDALLAALAAAGWRLQPGPYQTTRPEEQDSMINALISVHTALRPMGTQAGRTRRLTLIEARVGLALWDIDLNGLTVTCDYGRPAAKEEVGL